MSEDNVEAKGVESKHLVRQFAIITATLSDYVGTIKDGEGVDPIAVLSGEKGLAFIKLDSEIMNSEQLREAVFEVMRKKAKELEADIAMIAMDAYEHHQTEEQAKEELEYRKMNGGEPIPIEMRKTLGLAVSTQECVMLLIETKDRSLRINQYYERKDDKVILGEKDLKVCEPKMRIFGEDK